MATNQTSDHPLHILHCIFSMEVGGAETMLVDIINEQIDRNQKVTLLIINDKYNEQLLATLRPEVKVVKLMRKPGANPLKLIWTINKTICSLNPDIIHVHNSKSCFLIRVKRNRIVFTAHDINVPLNYVTPKIQIVAITKSVENDVLKRMPNAKITTILNGIRTKDILSRQDNLGPDKFKLVQVARLNSQKKGQDILINALGTLKSRGIENVEVTFIGDGADAEILHKLAVTNGVEKNVHFDGLRDRAYIYSRLKDFDAMCHPSRWEGFGLTIAEGMAAGLPLIVTEGDGPWEVADHGRLCESFPNGNVEECANAIERVMNNYGNALVRATLASQYVTRYDIAHTVDKYISLYHTMIKG